MGKKQDISKKELKEGKTLFEDFLNKIDFNFQMNLTQNKVTNKQNQIINLFYQALYSNKYEDKKPKAWGGKLYKSIKKENFEDNSINNFFMNILSQKINNSAVIKLEVERLPFTELIFLHIPVINWKKKKFNRDSTKIDSIRKNISFDERNFIIGGLFPGLVPAPIICLKKTGKNMIKNPNQSSESKLIKYIPFEINRNKDLNFTLPSSLEDFNSIYSLKKNINLILDYNIINREEKCNYNINTTYPNTKGFLNSLKTDKQIEMAAENINLSKISYISKRYVPFAVIYPLVEKKKSFIFVFNRKKVSLASIYHSLYTLNHLGANCYEFPYTRLYLPKKTTKSPYISIDINKSKKDIPIQYWTQNELNDLSEYRGIVNLPIWTEKELEDFKISRGFINLDEWTEAELEVMNNLRGQAIQQQIKWEPPTSTIECTKCRYRVFKEWNKCPICKQNIEDSEKSDDSNIEVWKPPPE